MWREESQKGTSNNCSSQKNTAVTQGQTFLLQPIFPQPPASLPCSRGGIRQRLRFQAKFKLKSRVSWSEMPMPGPTDNAQVQMCRASSIPERDQKGKTSREKEQANVLPASDAQGSITPHLSPPAFSEYCPPLIVYHICIQQPLQEKEESVWERRWKEKENQWLGPSY